MNEGSTIYGDPFCSLNGNHPLWWASSGNRTFDLLPDALERQEQFKQSFSLFSCEISSDAMALIAERM